MKILITNDDGIYAEGMIPFVKWAQRLGDVTVIAPKVEQSGKSHGITLREPFEVKEVDLIDGIKAYSVDSTPADCVRFAVLGQKIKYDLVFSGINRGYNIGQDMLYSGTVSAATEAACLGLKAVAFSTDVPSYYQAAISQLDFIWDYFTRNKLMEKHNLYNVNIPPKANDILITKQGGPYYSDEFPLHSEDNDLYMAHGICVYEDGDDISIDTHCTLRGYISVSPLSFNKTDMNMYNSLQICK